MILPLFYKKVKKINILIQVNFLKIDNYLTNGYEKIVRICSKI